MADASSLESFFASKRDHELLAQLDTTRIPRHVAIIMDGNGRWASKRGLPRIAGHRAGAKSVREAISTALELGVEYLTIYSFSSENWSRPKDEVHGLMQLFVEVLERELLNLVKMGVCLRVLGREEQIPESTRQAFARAQERTGENAKLTLLVALNYGGRLELVDAVRSVAADVAAGRLAADEVDEATISSHLYTAGAPDPDLVIRTSGEMRLSNFLLWQTAYSEFWATSVLWPDFKRHDFLRAIVDFQKRTRRFGGS